jgi:hypothetical protein
MRRERNAPFFAKGRFSELEKTFKSEIAMP